MAVFLSWKFLLLVCDFCNFCGLYGGIYCVGLIVRLLFFYVILFPNCFSYYFFIIKLQQGVNVNYGRVTHCAIIQRAGSAYIFWLAIHSWKLVFIIQLIPDSVLRYSYPYTFWYFQLLDTYKLWKELSVDLKQSFLKLFCSNQWCFKIPEAL